MIENRVVMYVDMRRSRSHLSSQLGPCARTLKRENFQLLVGFTSVARRSQMSHYIFHCCVVNDKIWADSYVWRLWNAVVFCFSKRLFVWFEHQEMGGGNLWHIYEGFQTTRGRKSCRTAQIERKRAPMKYLLHVWHKIFFAGLAQNTKPGFPG